MPNQPPGSGSGYHLVEKTYTSNQNGLAGVLNSFITSQAVNLNDEDAAKASEGLLAAGPNNHIFRQRVKLLVTAAKRGGITAPANKDDCARYIALTLYENCMLRYFREYGEMNAALDLMDRPGGPTSEQVRECFRQIMIEHGFNFVGRLLNRLTHTNEKPYHAPHRQTMKWFHKIASLEQAIGGLPLISAEQKQLLREKFTPQFRLEQQAKPAFQQNAAAAGSVPVSLPPVALPLPSTSGVVGSTNSSTTSSPRLQSGSSSPSQGPKGDVPLSRVFDPMSALNQVTYPLEEVEKQLQQLDQPALPKLEQYLYVDKLTTKQAEGIIEELLAINPLPTRLARLRKLQILRRFYPSQDAATQRDQFTKHIMRCCPTAELQAKMRAALCNEKGDLSLVDHLFLADADSCISLLYYMDEAQQGMVEQRLQSFYQFENLEQFLSNRLTGEKFRLAYRLALVKNCGADRPTEVQLRAFQLRDNLVHAPRINTARLFASLDSLSQVEFEQLNQAYVGMYRKTIETELYQSFGIEIAYAVQQGEAKPRKQAALRASGRNKKLWREVIGLLVQGQKPACENPAYLAKAFYLSGKGAGIAKGHKSAVRHLLKHHGKLSLTSQKELNQHYREVVAQHSKTSWLPIIGSTGDLRADLSSRNYESWGSKITLNKEPMQLTIDIALSDGGLPVGSPEFRAEQIRAALGGRYTLSQVKSSEAEVSRILQLSPPAGMTRSEYITRLKQQYHRGPDSDLESLHSHLQAAFGATFQAPGYNGITILTSRALAFLKDDPPSLIDQVHYHVHCGRKEVHQEAAGLKKLCAGLNTAEKVILHKAYETKFHQPISLDQFTKRLQQGSRIAIEPGFIPYKDLRLQLDSALDGSNALRLQEIGYVKKDHSSNTLTVNDQDRRDALVEVYRRFRKQLVEKWQGFTDKSQPPRGFDWLVEKMKPRLAFNTRLEMEQLKKYANSLDEVNPAEGEGSAAFVKAQQQALLEDLTVLRRQKKKIANGMGTLSSTLAFAVGLTVLGIASSAIAVGATALAMLVGVPAAFVVGKALVFRENYDLHQASLDFEEEAVDTALLLPSYLVFPAARVASRTMMYTANAKRLTDLERRMVMQAYRTFGQNRPSVLKQAQKSIQSSQVKAEQTFSKNSSGTD